MIRILDGRSHFYQWDTGRFVVVDSSCTVVHMRNSLATPAIPVEVHEQDGLYVAEVPPEFLQDNKDITVYAYTGTPDCGYTEEHETFEVIPKSKPADYVFTPTELITMQELQKIIQSVRDDADNGKFNGAPGKDGDKGDKGDKGDPGTPGKDGHTPVKGDDYFTEEDKKEFENYLESIVGIANTELESILAGGVD